MTKRITTVITCDACGDPIDVEGKDEVYMPITMVDGITRHFHYRHKVIMLRWSSPNLPLTAEVGPGGEP